MLEPNPLTNLPDLENVEWNYDQSVKKMRQLVVSWKTLSLELLRELYLARMILSNPGRRSDLNLSTNVERLTWTQYLNDVGLNHETVRRWLSKYDFDRHELVSVEPIRLPKEIEIDDVLPTTHSCPDCGYEYDGAPTTPVENGITNSQRLWFESSEEHQRHPEEFYPTHPAITKMLLDREELDGTIWEPACGKGDMSEVLIDNGYDVLSTDLIDRGYGEVGIDFLDDDQISRFGAVDYIISYPPFTFSLDFVLQAKKIARKKICILNSPMFLDGIKRYEMWIDKDFPLKNMYQFAGRVVFRKDGLSDQSQNGLIRFPRAWFVFEKGYTGKPTIDWILPELDINPSRASFPILSW